jgi:hypothetical protein
LSFFATASSSAFSKAGISATSASMATRNLQRNCRACGQSAWIS